MCDYIHGTADMNILLEIPTIICGDTYSELGFNLEPKNKNKYFSLLKKIKIIKNLKEQLLNQDYSIIYLIIYV